jgi:hypothetical protein
MNGAIANAVLAALAGSYGVSFADEGKDESGKRKERLGEQYKGDKHRGENREHGTQLLVFPSAWARAHSEWPPAYSGRMPHLGSGSARWSSTTALQMDRGQCRVEPGGLLMTPGPQPQEVEVAVYDVPRPGVVIDVRTFDARTGEMVRIVGAK